MYRLTQWISTIRGSFGFHWVRQYLVNFTGLSEIVNAIVYKTEPIVTGLEHGKVSYFFHTAYLCKPKMIIYDVPNHRYQI